MLNNLNYLKQDMVEKKWTICSFLFNYKSIEYIVLVKRFVATEKRINDYALVKLHFMKSCNLNDELYVEANSKGLLIDAKSLREYFGIEYSDNLGSIIHQFAESLGSFIPISIPDRVLDIEKLAMVKSLSKSDSEDPSKIYCTNIKRNAEGNTRSEFNADKTKLLRKALFEKFSDDESISFCYSNDSSKENNDLEIIRRFTLRL